LELGPGRKVEESLLVHAVAVKHPFDLVLGEWHVQVLKLLEHKLVRHGGLLRFVKGQHVFKKLVYSFIVVSRLFLLHCLLGANWACLQAVQASRHKSKGCELLLNAEYSL
jgi:hypothetical protein